MRTGTRLGLGVLLTIGAAAGAQTASLRPIPRSDTVGLAGRIPQNLLPPHSSHVEVEQKQVFSLVAAGQPDLLLVPVKFWHGEPEQLDTEHTLVDRDRCGLVLMLQGKPSSFVWTMTDTTDLAVDLCGGMTAIGAIAHEGGRPRLIAIYRTYSPPQFEDAAALVLVWDAARGTYVVDKKAFDYLNSGSNAGINTIAGVKAALARQGGNR